MKLVINILFCIIAGVMTYLSPNKYNFEFCLTLLVLYIVNNIYYFSVNKEENRNAAYFDFFFMFSYGMTNFIYPVFYKPVDPYYSIFSFSFNHHIISKSTAIAYLGYTFFILGISIYRKKIKKIPPKNKKEDLPSFKISNIFIRIIFLVAMLSFIGYFATGGLKELQRVYSGTGGDLNEVGVYSYFNNIFVICSNLLAIFFFLIKDKKTKMLTFSFIIVCSILLLMTGSRTVVLGLGLILLATYGRFVKRISFLKIILFIIIGSVFMNFIQQSRSDEFSEDKWVQNANQNIDYTSPLDVFNDLIINNRNLYLLVDFADSRGNVYFLNTVSEFTAPIPGLFNYILTTTGLPRELLFGGALPTFIEFGTESTWGLGTNLTGEMYVGFGYYGVCIIMFLLGILLKSTKNASRYNVYAYVAYYLLVSHAIFFPRAFYMYQPRTLVWSLLIVYILMKISNSLYRKRKKSNPVLTMIESDLEK